MANSNSPINAIDVAPVAAPLAGVTPPIKRAEYAPEMRPPHFSGLPFVAPSPRAGDGWNYWSIQLPQGGSACHILCKAIGREYAGHLLYFMRACSGFPNAQLHSVLIFEKVWAAMAKDLHSEDRRRRDVCSGFIDVMGRMLHDAMAPNKVDHVWGHLDRQLQADKDDLKDQERWVAEDKERTRKQREGFVKRMAEGKAKKVAAARGLASQASPG